jgi:RNA polymerase sigma-70 factor (ECF subfamily)
MDTPAAPSAALGKMRPLLMKLARLQLRNEAWAEDVVSETTLAALEQAGTFEARSKFQTWVIGILKHKIVDLLRRQHREISIEAQIEAGEIDDLDDLFDAEGRRLRMPLEWGDPEALMAQSQFLELIQSCINRLPPTAARVFVMREWLEYDTDEVCTALAITPSNCNVMMFRSRLRLRECIESRGIALRARRASHRASAPLAGLPAVEAA